ncbi:MAG: histidine kinase [Caldilineales bacterium]|nr:histidine kinase [Caldilineales bacterium]MDW8317286.1 histidine kinase [Anaerolineae bacterium]
MGSTGGLHGLTEAQRQRPDVVLIGVTAATASQALDLCRCIRADPHLMHTPLLMIAAEDLSADHRAEALAAGFNGYLLEPVHARELLAYVKGLVHAPEGLVRTDGRQSSVSAATLRVEAPKASETAPDRFLRRLAMDLRAGQEERRRMARALHDGLGQNLAALKMDLSMLRRQVERQEPIELQGLLDALSSALGLVDRSVEVLRGLAAELSLDSIESPSLAQEVESLVRDFRWRTGKPCKLTMEGLTAVTHTPATLALLTVLREVLAAAAHSAGPRQAVRVHLGLVEDLIELRAEDREGRLAAALEGSADRSAALLRAVEQVVALGGRVEPVRRCGPGSQIVVTMPVPLAKRSRAKRGR